MCAAKRIEYGLMNSRQTLALVRRFRRFLPRRLVDARLSEILVVSPFVSDCFCSCSSCCSTPVRFSLKGAAHASPANGSKN